MANHHPCPVTLFPQARKAQVAKHALARGMDPSQQEDQGRINLEDFKRFFA
jgi:hypothetical protein